MTSNNETVPAKCHERATLRELWRQMENSSLLNAKCWPLLHVIRSGLMLSLESHRVFQNLLLFCFVSITNHLESQCFPRRTLRFSENKIHCYVLLRANHWVFTGAIIGDGDHKSWDACRPMIWDNFSIFRTNCAILTSYIRAAPRTCRGFSRGCCHAAWSKIVKGLRVFTAMAGNKAGKKNQGSFMHFYALS